jgi:hypothetical protein
MRALFKLLLLGIAVFAAAFAIRHVFFAGIVSVAAAEEAQSLWALDVAFGLRTIENIAIFGNALLLIAIIAGWFGQGGNAPSAKASSGE